jgi:hypothetical protein
MKQKNLLDIKMQGFKRRIANDLSNLNSINDNIIDNDNSDNINSNHKINKSIHEDFTFEENENNNASISENIDPDIDYVINEKTAEEKIKRLIEFNNEKKESKDPKKDNENNDNDKDKKNKIVLRKINKLTRTLSFKRILGNILRCRCYKIYQAQKIFKKAEEAFDNHKYVKSYVDKMREIECMKKFIFNQEEEKLFTN